MDFESFLFATNSCTQIDETLFCFVFPQLGFIPTHSLFAYILCMIMFLHILRQDSSLNEMCQI